MPGTARNPESAATVPGQRMRATATWMVSRPVSMYAYKVDIAQTMVEQTILVVLG